MTSRKKKILSGLAISLGLLATAELALRAVGFRFPPLDAPLAIWNPDEDRNFDQANNLHQREVRQLWGLRPSSALPWGSHETINEKGYRGPLLTRERARPNALRIATLGDSSTFGWGVPYSECYSAALEALYRAQGIQAEVLDAGVIGFTVRQGLERYRELVRPFSPDVVVAAFGAVNEHHAAPGTRSDAIKIESNAAANSIWMRIGRFVRVHSRVIHALDKLVLEARGGRAELLRQWRARMDIHEEGQKRCGEIAYAGPRRVSLDDFRRALGELADEVEKDHARLILVSMPRESDAELAAPVLMLYSDAVEQVARERHLLFFDARSAIRARQESDPDTPLFLDGDHWHPSAAGHRLIAQGLLPLVTAHREE